MNTPNAALMRMYGTHEEFFKKASGGKRVLDEVGEKVASELVTALRESPTALEKVGMNLGVLLAKEAFQIPVMPPRGAAPKLPKPNPAPGAVMPKPGAPGALAAPPRKPLPSPETGVKRTAPLPPPPGAPAAAGPTAAPASAFGVQPPPSRKEMQPTGPLPKPNAPPKPPEEPPGMIDKAKATGGKLLNRAKWLGLGGLALGGYAAYKGLGAAKDIAEAAAGAGNPGYGYSPGGYYVPNGVNAYGVPQMGTPLM